jgi:hypothetical protein
VSSGRKALVEAGVVPGLGMVEKLSPYEEEGAHTIEAPKTLEG